MLLSRAALACTLVVGLCAASQLTFALQDPGTSQKPLTNQDVVEMTKAGLAPEIIIAKIRTSPAKFDTSPAGLRALKADAVPDAVILAMVEAPTAPEQDTPQAPAVRDEPPRNDDVNSGPAHLFVYRARRFVGSSLAPSIYVDDRQVVRVGNGRRCAIKLSPGTHNIRSDDKSSAISLEAKPGQQYFIRVDEEAGFWKGHGKLTLVASEQGAAEYKLQKAVEPDRKIATDLIEDDVLPSSETKP